MATPRDVLLGEDVAAKAELLLNLLNDATAGRDINAVVSEVIQVTIAGGLANVHIKRLAYDLCKAVPLSDSDCGSICDGVKNDIQSGQPELQVLGLSYIPYLPASSLIHLSEKGIINGLVLPNARNAVPAVRAAAADALSSLLLAPEVQEALVATPSLVRAAAAWWDSAIDGVLDAMPEVIVSGVAAANRLFGAACLGTSGGAQAGAGHAELVAANAQRIAQRVLASLGPLLDTWRMLPAAAQVAVCHLLGHLAAHLLSGDAYSGGGGARGGSGGDALPAALDEASAGVTDHEAGTLSAALPAIVAYLNNTLSSLNPAAKMEAAKVLLRIVRAGSGVRGAPRADERRLSTAVPPAVAAAAIESLLELRDRPLVEAALEEVTSLIACHLDVLQVSSRRSALQRLWPLIALLQSPSDRMTAFAHAWRAALELHLDTSEARAQGVDLPGGATLDTLLSDPFLQDALDHTPSAPPNGGAQLAGGAPSPLPTMAEEGPAGDGPDSVPPTPGSGAGAAASPGGGGGGGVPVAAGFTGGSVPSVSAGPTGGSLPIGAGFTGGSGGGGGGAVSLQRSNSGKRLLKSATSRFTTGARSMSRALGNAAAGGMDSAGDLLRTAAARILDGGPVTRPALPATLKHELACTLLEVINRHPSAGISLKLPAGEPVSPPPPATAAAAKTDPRAPRLSTASSDAGAGDAAAAAAPAAGAAAGLSANGTAPSMPPQQQLSSLLAGGDSAAAALAEQQARAVLWIGAAAAALQLTRGCVSWEPLVPPPLPGVPPAPPLPPMATVNLTTVPVDLWLQLLQATCHAVRAVMRLHGHSSLVSVYRCNGGRMLRRLSRTDGGALAAALEGAAVGLQTILQWALGEWRVLALAVRPRVLWVGAHYLELPSMLDETWEQLLACVEDALIRIHRAEADGHTRQLAVSATDGVLLRAYASPTPAASARGAAGGGHLNFDVAAASALVELPEYRADSLQVGLSVLQYLVWQVQSSVAKLPTRAAGATEAALAHKLTGIIRAAGAADVLGPDQREWCRRMQRALGGVLAAGTGGAGGGGGASGAGGGTLFGMAPPPPLPPAAAGGGPAAPSRGALPSGYNPVAGFSALGFGGGAARDSSSDDEPSGGGGGGGAGDDDTPSSDAGSRRSRLAGGSSDEEEEEGEDAESDGEAASTSAAASGLHSDPHALVGAWGYPFGGPRSNTLFISRRSRRHRMLHRQLAAAFANLQADVSAAGRGQDASGITFAAAGGTDDTGPVFSAGSGFRLDKRSFWASLPGGAPSSAGWQELSGASDPLLLAGSYALAEGGGEVVVTLRAHNRLDADVEGVEVHVRLVGPVKAERREAVWHLPKLLPTEAATHVLKLAFCGYGQTQVHCRIQLPVEQLRSEAALPTLQCAPLSVSLAHALRAPDEEPPSAERFLVQWDALPLRAQLAATCVWPGLDGLLLALSALSRAPGHTAWLRALPAVCGAHAAYVSAPAAAPGDTVALMVSGQLMPEAAAPAAPAARADATAGDAGAGSGGDDDDAAPAGSVGEAAAAGEGGAAAAPPPELRQRAAVAVLLRSSSQEVMQALRSDPAAWLRDMSQGTLSLGLVQPQPPRLCDQPLLHPATAKLAAVFGAAPRVLPPPPPVSDPVMPPEPEVLRRLRPKKDDEDSDAEDTELPLTSEEVAAEEAAREQHADACRQVHRAHKRALADRAVQLMQAGALAEWRRICGASVA